MDSAAAVAEADSAAADGNTNLASEDDASRFPEGHIVRAKTNVEFRNSLFFVASPKSPCASGGF